MATTEYGVGHAMAVQKWSRDLMKEALSQTQMLKFMGKGSNSLIKVKDELKDHGYKVTFGLRVQLKGKGVSGDGTLEGKEEPLSIYTDAVEIDQLRHAVRTHGRASEQRVPFSTRDEAKDGLADWWSARVDTSVFNQLAGVTGLDVEYTGMNSVTATDSDHIIYQGEASEAALSDTAGNTFTISLFDEAIERAKTFSQADGTGNLMRPLKINGEDYFVAFLHPYQVKDLRTHVSSTEITWYEVQKARLQGGQGQSNPIFTGAQGVYNGVIIHESSYVPAAPGNAQAYRALFCGAQAGNIAFGKGSGPNKMTWVEELFDYKNQLGVASGLVWGAKKCMYNAQNHSAIVLSTGAGK